MGEKIEAGIIRRENIWVNRNSPYLHMTWLGIEAKQSNPKPSCIYDTGLVCVDKANIVDKAKGIYWRCKAVHRFVIFSQAGETFERANTKNKFHDSERKGVPISQFKNDCGELRCPLQELESLSQGSELQELSLCPGGLRGCSAGRFPVLDTEDEADEQQWPETRRRILATL